MRSYLLFNALFFLSFAITAQSGELASYCNQQFDFCIHYPESLFNKKTDLNNGEGVVLSSASGDIQLEILGITNINDWTTKDIYYFKFEEILTMHPSNRLLNAKIEPEFAIVESIINKERKYFEIRMRDGYYISMNLKVPEYFSELDYQHLLSQIGLANAALEE